MANTGSLVMLASRSSSLDCAWGLMSSGTPSSRTAGSGSGSRCSRRKRRRVSVDQLVVVWMMRLTRVLSSCGVAMTHEAERRATLVRRNERIFLDVEVRKMEMKNGIW